MLNKKQSTRTVHIKKNILTKILICFQDSVRQLLGGPRHTMRQLNNALDDALAGFDDSAKNEDEELVIDENPRKNAKSSSPIKLTLNVATKSDAKPKRKLVSDSRATMEDMRMTKAHQV